MRRHWNKVDLCREATLYFGPSWQTVLANKVEVNPRTVRRWASGETNVPMWVRYYFSGLAGAGTPLWRNPKSDEASQG